MWWSIRQELTAVMPEICPTAGCEKQPRKEAIASIVVRAVFGQKISSGSIELL